jgi:tellurite resistance protein TehA-like permease
MHKTIAKVLFWVGMGLLLVAIVFMSMLVYGLNGVFGIVGLSALVAAFIVLICCIWQFILYDAEVTQVPSGDDVPKAH